jgi:hypothetical protein
MRIPLLLFSREDKTFRKAKCKKKGKIRKFLRGLFDDFWEDVFGEVL